MPIIFLVLFIVKLYYFKIDPKIFVCSYEHTCLCVKVIHIFLWFSVHAMYTELYAKTNSYCACMVIYFFCVDDFRLFCGDLGNEVNDDILSKAFSKYPSFNMARVSS